MPNRRYSEAEAREKRLETFRKTNKKRTQYSVTYGLSEKDQLEISSINNCLAKEKISGNGLVRKAIHEYLIRNGYQNPDPAEHE